MIQKLIVIKVHRDNAQMPISVRVQILSENDKFVLETILPIQMFNNVKGIEVGRKILLTCDY
jgi:hypothetical protein